MDPKKTRNGAETEPNGAETEPKWTEIKLSGWDGRGGGVVGMGGGVCKGKRNKTSVCAVSKNTVKIEMVLFLKVGLWIKLMVRRTTLGSSRGPCCQRDLPMQGIILNWLSVNCLLVV